tara:strand:- start:367 stop:1512 length:1146 start_codon:yes stop_codon:yes gene_type:complete
MSTGHSTTPVRLVSQSGRFYDLNCTSVSIDVDRNVFSMPVPFTGSSRIMTDMNLTKGIITLEGVITDGDASLVSVGNQAEASIDFSATTADFDSRFVGSIISYSYAHGNFDPSSVGLNDDTYADGNSIVFWRGTVSGGEKDVFTVFFGVNNAAAGYDTTLSPNEYILSYHDGTSAKTAAELATGLHNLITNEIPTINSQIIAGRNAANSQVVLTFSNVPSGNTYTNSDLFPNPSFIGYVPRIVTFNKGIESSNVMSAGDTVQQLYAIISNSNNRWSENIQEDSHYIVGLQLPFLSSEGVVSGEKYVSRLMYSNAGYSANISKNDNYSKLSSFAGSTFENNHTGFANNGIKAVVDKANFAQVGGEPNVYTFTIILMVTNMIL